MVHVLHAEMVCSVEMLQQLSGVSPWRGGQVDKRSLVTHGGARDHMIDVMLECACIVVVK